VDTFGRYEHYPDPITLAVVGGGLAIGGAGVGAYGAIQEGDAANAAGMNAEKIGRMQAKEIEAKTGFDQLRQAEEGARTLSTIEAAQGASGAVTTQGSPLLVKAKQASELELENMMIGREGGIAADRARYEGKLARWQGKAAQGQGYLKAGGTLLQGFGTAVSGFSGVK